MGDLTYLDMGPRTVEVIESHLSDILRCNPRLSTIKIKVLLRHITTAANQVVAVWESHISKGMTSSVGRDALKVILECNSSEAAQVTVELDLPTDTALPIISTSVKLDWLELVQR